MTTESLPVLAILGGTGDLGTGLARRWAQAGYEVIIGSRTQEKAEAAVADLREVMAERGVAEISVRAMENLAAAEAAAIITLTVPFSHQAGTLELVKPVLAGKILIDVTVPLVPPRLAAAVLHQLDLDPSAPPPPECPIELATALADLRRQLDDAQNPLSDLPSLRSMDDRTAPLEGGQLSDLEA